MIISLTLAKPDQLGAIYQVINEEFLIIWLKCEKS